MEQQLALAVPFLSIGDVLPKAFQMLANDLLNLHQKQPRIIKSHIYIYIYIYIYIKQFGLYILE